MPQRDSAPKLDIATFRERGVCMPLTTPMLVGARVRQTDRHGLELVVPKALGADSNYIVQWRSIPDLCQPGVHDTRLIDRVGMLRPITPATVREAALQTAAEGFAGRRVRAAARAAAAAEQEARALTNYHLILLLARQLEPASLQNGPLRPAQFEAVAKRAMARASALLRCDPDAVAAALRGLSASFASIGLGERVGTARLPTLLTTVQSVRQSVGALNTSAAWATAAALYITKNADLTLSCLTSALSEARGLTENMLELLRAWLGDQPGMSAWIGRGDWLGDGWNWLCLLWAHAADRAAQLHALEELADILPALPQEARHWAGFTPGGSIPGRLQPRAAPEQGEPEAMSVLDAIMRNEALLALAA